MSSARKLFVVAMCCMFAQFVANAQPLTVCATVAGGSTQNNIYVAVGEPFFQQISDNGYEFAYGVAQAQLVRDTVYDALTYNEPYARNGFNLPTQTDSHVDSVYLVNGGPYHYDLIRTLYLIVCPENVADMINNNIVYDAVGVSGHCWTKQNLRSPLSGALVYQSVMNPTVPQVYGLLYDWNTALNGTLVDAEGNIQGICPNSWHLPNAAEMSDLFTNPVMTLRSTEGWVNTEVNDNSTGFTAYPAGLYNASTQRFEGLGTQTDWWMSVSDPEVMNIVSLQLPYFCESPIFQSHSSSDALSVRCVMKNIWPE